MDWFIKKNATLPLLKLAIIKDGRSDYNNFMELLETSTIFFSMVNTENGIPKITSRPAGFVEKIFDDPNAEPEYYIYYKFTNTETNTVGKFEGQFLIKTFEGNVILPIREKLFIYVQESFIADNLEYDTCYTSVFPCCLPNYVQPKPPFFVVFNYELIKNNDINFKQIPDSNIGDDIIPNNDIISNNIPDNNIGDDIIPNKDIISNNIPDNNIGDDIIPNNDLYTKLILPTPVPPPGPDETLYYIRILNQNAGNALVISGFFYVNNTTHIVLRFYDLVNPTVDIRSTGNSGGPTYLYYPGWLCFDGGGCNITIIPYFSPTLGDYNLYGSTSSSNGIIGGFGNFTYEFSLVPFI
jgi:hypothetical protein